MPDRYRSAASVLVLRRTTGGSGFQFLLLHKPRRSDAWQLPQGGVEGDETIEAAALRELMEEAGIGNCMVLGKSDRVYKYDFPPSFRRFRPDNVCGQTIAFVFALVDPATVVKVDGKEIDAHVWVTLPQIFTYVRRKAYADLVAALYDEALKLAEHHSA